MEKYKLKSGEYRYREMCYLEGRLKKSPAFKRKADAIAWKNKTLAERDKQKALGLKSIQTRKVEFVLFANEWLESKVKPQRSESTYVSYKQIINTHLKNVFGSKYLTEIGHYEADKLITYLKERGHNERGINKILGVLKTIFRYAEEIELIAKSSLSNFKNLKENKKAADYWTEEEINIFLRACISDSLYPLYTVALNTGLRRGELAGLMWDKVDFQRGLIQVARIRDRYGLKEKTKGLKTRFVPMNPVTFSALQRLKAKSNSVYVFTQDNGEPIAVHHLYRKFGYAQKKANMQKTIKFHGLRHTFASNFMMRGGNVYDLQKILGHSKLEMTEIYAHLSPQHLANTTSILSFHGETNQTYPNSNHEQIESENEKLISLL